MSCYHSTVKCLNVLYIIITRDFQLGHYWIERSDRVSWYRGNVRFEYTYVCCFVVLWLNIRFLINRVILER